MYRPDADEVMENGIRTGSAAIKAGVERSAIDHSLQQRHVAATTRIEASAKRGEREIPPLSFVYELIPLTNWFRLVWRITRRAFFRRYAKRSKIGCRYR
jgi:hypothetical protein